MNPYPGLRPFEDNDEDVTVFFGRDSQVDDLLARLQHERFVGIVGQSGCGKSSLVRAGLLPALHAGFIAGAGSHWRIALMRPGSRPIEMLARALEQSGALERVSDDEAMRIGLTRAVLESGALGLVEAVRQARLDPGQNVLIVVDQFEELFRYKHAVSAAHVADEAAAFVKLLLEAANSAELPIYIVITMRSDFIGECAAFRGLPERLNDSLFLVPRLTRDQLREAIVGPAGIAGATIAPELVNRLLNELGDDPDQLPVLQHALMRTWNVWETRHRPQDPVSVADYERTGGLTNALSQHGDEVYNNLPSDAHRETAARIFRALTEDAGDGRGIRHPTAFGVLVAIAATSAEQVTSVVNAFRKRDVSFLSPLGDEPLQNTSIVDLSHEAVMRTWTRLKEWTAREGEAARLYRRLLDEAAAFTAGQAAPLAEPYLSYAEQWVRDDRPNEAWAQRYSSGDALAGVLSFISASRQAADLEKDRERETERLRADARVARRTRSLAIFASIVALLAIGALAAAIVLGQRAAAAANEAANARAALMEDQMHNTQAALAAESKQRALENNYNKQLRVALKSAAALAVANKRLAAIAQSSAKKLQASEDSSQIAQLDSALFEAGNIDLRSAGIIAADANELSQTNAALSTLLFTSITSDSLGRVATPPWNLGAVTGNGSYAVILAGKQQSYYREPVAGALAVINVDDLGVHSRLGGVTATLMCGAEGRSQVSIATGTRIDTYAVPGAGAPRRTWSFLSGPVEALACLPYIDAVAYVDASHTLRLTNGTRNIVIGNVGAPTRGLALSQTGLFAAAITGDGTISIFSLLHGKVSSIPRALVDMIGDCAGTDGCGNTVTFAANDGSIFFYDEGKTHKRDLKSGADSTIACAKWQCAHPRFAWEGNEDWPIIIAYGSLSSDGKTYVWRYTDRTSTTHAVVDPERALWLATYDPEAANRPNPLGGGLATHSYHYVQAPTLGIVEDSQWPRSYFLRGSEVLIPANPSDYVTHQLDAFRAPPELSDVSYHVRAFDSGDGRYGAAFNYVTGELDVIDLAAARRIAVLHTARVPVDATHHYKYVVEAAYDPANSVVTRFAHSAGQYADLARYDMSGHVLEHLSLAQLTHRAGFDAATVVSWQLSSRGNYIAVDRGDHTDYLLRFDGNVVGTSGWIRDISPDERLAFANRGTSKTLTMFRLPQWAPLALTPIPTGAVHLTRAPNGRMLAYDDAGTLKLYDPISRISLTSTLSPPFDIKLAKDNKTPDGDLGLEFSADSRYLLMSYITTDNQKHLVAYSVDPNAWTRSICLMAGKPLSPGEFRPIVGNVKYRDGCAPFASIMYY